LRQRIGALSDDLRRVAYRLHPSALEHLGLVVAIESLCAEFSTAERIQVRFRKQDVPRTLPADIALCIFRVTQECLRNVARHSGATRAYVALVGGKDGLGLVISDRGTGFDLELVKGKKGLGLVSIAERVRLVGGTLAIQTRPGDGARIELRIPLPPETP